VPAAGEAGLGGGRIVVGSDGSLTMSGVEPEVRPHQLDEDDVGVVAGLLDVAADRESTEPDPEEAAARLSSPFGAAYDPQDGTIGSADALATVASSAAARNPAGGLAALMADVDVVVRVLGEVEAVRRAGDSWDETRRLEVSRQKALEIITYLAMRDTAVEREDLEINLFPDGTSAPKTVDNLVSTARKVLGDELFPQSDGRRYRVSDRVVTDYALFYELTAQADETDDRTVEAELLAESLDLVMGEPFTGAGRGFAWVGTHRGIIVAQVIDAAEALAELHLASGNWRAAEWAARKGLRVFPTDERMYRILMRTASASGNVPGVHRVFRELCQVIADPDTGVEPEDSVHPETVALLEDLTGSQRPAS
jgi:DNA-binding SARP family transcriptional activator